MAHYGEMGRRMGIKGVDSWKTWQDADDFQVAYAVREALDRSVVGAGWFSLVVVFSDSLFLF